MVYLCPVYQELAPCTSAVCTVFYLYIRPFSGYTNVQAALLAGRGTTASTTSSLIPVRLWTASAQPFLRRPCFTSCPYLSPRPKLVIIGTAQSTGPVSRSSRHPVSRS